MKFSFKKIKTNLLLGTAVLGLSLMAVACTDAPLGQLNNPSAPQPSASPADVTAPSVVSNIPANQTDLKVFRLGGMIKVTVSWSEPLSSTINSQNIQVSKVTVVPPNFPTNNNNGTAMVLTAPSQGDVVDVPVNNATYALDPMNPANLIISVPYDSGENPEIAVTVGPGAVSDPSGNANTDTTQFDFTTSFKLDNAQTAI